MPSRPTELLPDQPFKTLTLRLPIDIYTRIASLAARERRTLHSQLLVLIEQALEQQQES